MRSLILLACTVPWIAQAILGCSVQSCKYATKNIKITGKLVNFPSDKTFAVVLESTTCTKFFSPDNKSIEDYGGGAILSDIAGSTVNGGEQFSLDMQRIDDSSGGMIHVFIDSNGDRKCAKEEKDVSRAITWGSADSYDLGVVDYSEGGESCPLERRRR